MGFLNNWVGRNILNPTYAAGNRVVGAVTPPGKTRDQLFTRAKNTTNPDVNWVGATNPKGWVAPKSSSQPPSGLADQWAAEVAAATARSGGGGGFAGGGFAGGGGGGAVDPDTDVARVGSERAKIMNMMQLFDQAFNEALARVDALANDKRTQLTDNQKTQQGSLDKNYETTSRGIDDQFSARNAYRSSYREGAQQQAQEAYDTATTGLQSATDKDLANVGQFAESQKAQFNTGRPSFDVNAYDKVSDLLSIGQDVDQAIKQLKATSAGLGTTGEYMGKLNAIAPAKETGSDVLKTQLDKLAGTSANADTKRRIALTTIKNAGQDPSAWQDYFEKQLSVQGSQVPNNQALVVV